MSSPVSKCSARGELFDSLVLSLSKDVLAQDVPVEPRALRSSFDKLRMSVWVLIASVTLWAPVRAQPGDTRLVEAVKRRDEKAFTALLKAKADVNAVQPDGATALAWAVHLGERTMAEALLDSGANA